uniref:Uncharacterized protein n=1 Tax=Solanum tuberosum TaxID=4113 RepID=M0ZI44_SOLTU
MKLTKLSGVEWQVSQAQHINKMRLYRRGCQDGDKITSDHIRGEVKESRKVVSMCLSCGNSLF